MQFCEHVGLFMRCEGYKMRTLRWFLWLLHELTVKSVVGGIVANHGFNHERFDGLQDSSLVWGGVHLKT